MLTQTPELFRRVERAATLIVRDVPEEQRQVAGHTVRGYHRVSIAICWHVIKVVTEAGHPGQGPSVAVRIDQT